VKNLLLGAIAVLFLVLTSPVWIWYVLAGNERGPIWMEPVLGWLLWHGPRK
jgi:hypothetical protein